jgi:hypothetical protein
MLAGLAACTDGKLYPDFPMGAVNIQPLEVYERWWAMTEQCSGLQGDFHHVLFYQIPGASAFDFRRYRHVPAIWMEDDRIIIAESSLRSGQVVRHEMLHSLMQKGQHDRSEFAQQCAGIVDCGATCLVDAGPPPAELPNTEEVDAAELEVNVAVWPETPSQAFLDGYVEVTVTARNPTDRPIRVRLDPPDTVGALGISFRQNLDGLTSRYLRQQNATVVESTRFAPGETKREVFSYWIGGTSTQAPLTSRSYVAHGAFAGAWTDSPITLLLRN